MQNSSYNESRLWSWYERKNQEYGWNNENFNNFESAVKTKEKIISRISSSINNINRIITKLWQNSDVIETVNKKIKWLSTFDACGIFIWEVEKVCDKSDIPLLEEYRYCVNTAKQDKNLMDIIEQSLQICLELDKIRKPNPPIQGRNNPNPFWTTFRRNY